MYVLWGGLQEKGYFADFWKHKRQAMFYERINNVPKALAHVDMAKKCLALVPFPVLHARIRAHSFKLNMRVHILTDAHPQPSCSCIFTHGHDAKSVAYHIDSGFFLLVFSWVTPFSVGSFRNAKTICIICAV